MSLRLGIPVVAQIYQAAKETQNLFMCLAIPMKIVERSGDSGVVEIRGVRRSVTLSLVDAVIGDYVLVHAGVAIGKVDEKEAEETAALLEELIREG